MGKVIKIDFAKTREAVRADGPRNIEAERMEKVKAGHWIGSKYKSGADVADVAKFVRKDIKAARKAGELPDGKYSVRISRYSMGCSLTVNVSGLGFETANMDCFRAEALSPDLRHYGVVVLPIYSEKANDLRDKLKAIVNAYNYNKSDSMTDYFDYAFSETISIALDYEGARKRAEAEMAETNAEWDGLTEEEQHEALAEVLSCHAEVGTRLSCYEALVIAKRHAALFKRDPESEPVNAHEDYLAYLGVTS